MSSEANKPATDQGDDGAEQPSPKQPTVSSSAPISRGFLIFKSFLTVIYCIVVNLITNSVSTDNKMVILITIFSLPLLNCL
jgi:hypothetical protein